MRWRRIKAAALAIGPPTRGRKRGGEAAEKKVRCSVLFECSSGSSCPPSGGRLETRAEEELLVVEKIEPFVRKLLL